MAEKRERIVLKITDVETGAEQISGDFTVIPGFGFCCSCSSSSLTSLPGHPGPLPQQVEAATKVMAKH